MTGITKVEMVITRHTILKFWLAHRDSTTGALEVIPAPEQRQHNGGTSKDNVIFPPSYHIDKANNETESCLQSRAMNSRTCRNSPYKIQEILTINQRVRDRATRGARVHLRPAFHSPDGCPITHAGLDLMPEQQKTACARQGV